MKNKTTPPPAEEFLIPDFGNCLIPVSPANVLPRIREEIESLDSEIAQLQSLALSIESVEDARNQFSPEQARREHESAEAALRSDPSPANIERLKNIGSLEEKLRHFGNQFKLLEARALEIRREAFPLISEVTKRVCGRLVAVIEEARQEEAALYQSWGIQPPPSPTFLLVPNTGVYHWVEIDWETQSRLVAGVCRALQEFTINLDRENNPLIPLGVGVRWFLQMLGQ